MEAVDKEDAILELAIEYVLTNGYPPSLSKDRKRAVYMYNVSFSFCHCFMEWKQLIKKTLYWNSLSSTF